MEQTFTKEIYFFNPACWDDEAKQHVGKEVSKTATFKQLNRNDREQRKFQFMLTSIFKSKNENDISVDHEVLSDITEQFVEVMLTPDATFTETDKAMFLNDNIAVIEFALWLLKEKLSPFFVQLAQNLKR